MSEELIPSTSLGSAPQVTAQDLMGHPRFSEAVRQHVRIALFVCSDHPLAREFFGNSARQMSLFYIAMLSARSEIVASEPPLTRTRLQEALKPWGLLHYGKIDALINRLIDLGLITKQRLVSDRRIVVIQPTEAFFVLFDKIVAPHVVPAALLVDDAFLSKVASHEPSVAIRYRSFGVFQVENLLGILQRVPQMWAFARHDSGWLILFVLIDAIWRGDDAARKPASIARFLGVSRPHVTNVLSSAFEIGLLEETAPGLFAPTADFWIAVDSWVAECLAASINFALKD